MKTENLFNAWNDQNSNMPTTDEMVRELFMQSRQDRIGFNLKKLVLVNILFMLFNGLVIGFALKVVSQNLQSTGIVITGIFVSLLSCWIFYRNVFQLRTISKIKFSEPVVFLQKMLETLKIQRIKHNREIFIFSYLYFWGMVSLVFQWDLIETLQAIWINAPLYLVIQIALAVLWFPLAFFILQKYDTVKNASGFWGKMEKESYLTDGSLNTTLNRSLSYLNEIEAFKKE